MTNLYPIIFLLFFSIQQEEQEEEGTILYKYDDFKKKRGK